MRAERAVIGVPAHFTQAQRDATRRAATAAGLLKVRLLEEPVPTPTPTPNPNPNPNPNPKPTPTPTHNPTPYPRCGCSRSLWRRP